MNIPKPNPLPKTEDPFWDEDDYPDIPYVIVGDDGFQLADYMMKFYSVVFDESVKTRSGYLFLGFVHFSLV